MLEAKAFPQQQNTTEMAKEIMVSVIVNLRTFFIILKIYTKEAVLSRSSFYRAHKR